MGRRKLTKVFMQNGAEPAIKNKQNETAMDIALRKDLIDIQELIANPPPAEELATPQKSASKSRSRPNLLLRPDELELDPRNYAAAGDCPDERRRRRRGLRRRHAHRNLSSNEEEEPEEEDEENNSASQLEQRLARLGLRGGAGRRLRGGDGLHELPVDVPLDAEGRGRRQVFASVQSLGPLAKVKQPAASRALTSGQQRHQMQRRTKTLQSGLDLHLLPELGALRLEQQAAQTRRNLGASATRLEPPSERSASVDVAASTSSCLAPDARDEPSVDWADIMARSGRFQAEVKATKEQEPSHVIQAGGSDWRLAAEAEVEQTTAAGRTKQKDGRRRTVGGGGSPAGSVRSSIMGKSRGRLVISGPLHRKFDHQSGGCIYRLPAVRRQINLGANGGVGKLSLLRLRNLVNKRVATNNENDNEEEDDEDFVEIDRVEENDARKEPPEAAQQQQSSAERKPVTSGRRQERESRQQKELQAESETQRAPNGIKLVATMALAPLDDDTQLYAVPRKPKPQAATKQQQQQVASGGKGGASSDKQPASSAAEVPAAAEQVERTASGGPALTSDGCHSSSSGSSVASRSTSPPVGSSSDECVRALDLGPLRGGGASGQRSRAELPAQAKPEISDLYPAPGYSVIREQESPSGGAQCLCDQEVVDEAEPETGDKQEKSKQQAATKSGSRLRQLLHLEPKSQSRAEVPPATQAEVGNKSQGAKRSWLMSRFSLSSGNLSSRQQQSNLEAASECSNESDSKLDDRNSSGSCVANEDEPSGEQRGTNKNAEDKRTGNGQLVTEEDDGLIKPKSLLANGTGSGNSRHSELIAAQKSLAAAAAAKVKRDRLFKMSMVPATGSATCNGDGKLTSGSGGVLTVKTSSEFWGAGGKYMIGGHGAINRSGTNSAGMSDSSPSNNGAESDNSIQTTSGSMNTAASGSESSATGSQPASSSAASAQPAAGSLGGILSRILLNNTTKQQQQQSLLFRQQQVASGGQCSGISGGSSSNSTLRNGQSAGSLSSSSALSSPATSNEAHSPPGGVTVAPEEPHKQQLEQLGQSRSRCPIVLARGNEPLAQQHEHPQVQSSGKEPAPAPRLPAKSALKSVPSEFRPLGVGADYLGQPLPMDPMNGLPRVASYTQVSAAAADPLARYYNGHQPQSSLCNYHTAISHLNQRPATMIQYNNSPYLAAAYSAGYPIQTGNERRAKTAAPSVPQQHLSHLDLRQLDQPNCYSSALDLTLPASAINYEYYLDSPLGHSDGLKNANLRQSYYSNQHQQADESIYIPHIYPPRQQPHRLHQSNGSGQQQQRPSTAMAEPALNQQPRPKSSLDSFHLANTNGNHHNQFNENHLSHNNHHHRISMLSHLSSANPCYSYAANPIDHQSRRPSDQTTSYLYSTENLIYASDQSAAFMSRHSDLRVLPTTATSSQASDSVKLQPQEKEPGGSSPVASAASTYRASPSLIGQLTNSSAEGGDRAHVGQRATSVDRPSSWRPNAYRSLVQVNQSSAAATNKCNEDHNQEKEDEEEEEEEPASIVISSNVNGTGKQTGKQVICISGNQKKVIPSGATDTDARTDNNTRSSSLEEECTGSTVL